MWIHSLCRGILLGFLALLLFTASFCYGDDKTVEVVGNGQCADCKESNIKTGHAFSGLRVTIDCKLKNGEFKTRGVGELDEEGKFKVSLPQEILNDGKLKEDCFAQLHSASAAPCSTYNGLEASKIIFKSKSKGKHTFGPTGKLKFSSTVCTSAFFWSYHQFPQLPNLSPLPKLPPFKFFGHPFALPPLPPKVFPPIYKKTFPPPVPIFKKPSPPPVPIYKKPIPPPVPVYKNPLPPPVPIYKKPLPPPPVPIFKKPCPPPVPKYKKPLPPTIPKPLPPAPGIPKKPCPPFPKLPPFPKIPPKYFNHPKVGFFPPVPPYSPSP